MTGQVPVAVGTAVVVRGTARVDPRGVVVDIIDNGGPAQQPIYKVRFNRGGAVRALWRSQFEIDWAIR